MCAGENAFPLKMDNRSLQGCEVFCDRTVKYAGLNGDFSYKVGSMFDHCWKVYFT